MTNAGENKSIWFDAERLDKIEQITAAYEQQTGMRASRSAIVMRAIDELFLTVCLPGKPIASEKRQTTDTATTN